MVSNWIVEGTTFHTVDLIFTLIWANLIFCLWQRDWSMWRLQFWHWGSRMELGTESTLNVMDWYANWCLLGVKCLPSGDRQKWWEVCVSEELWGRGGWRQFLAARSCPCVPVPSWMRSFFLSSWNFTPSPMKALGLIPSFTFWTFCRIASWWERDCDGNCHPHSCRGTSPRAAVKCVFPTLGLLFSYFCFSPFPFSLLLSLPFFFFAGLFLPSIFFTQRIIR